MAISWKSGLRDSPANNASISLSAGGVLEIASSVYSAVDLTLDGAGLAIETAIVAATGTDADDGGLADGAVLYVIVYGPSNTAGLYQATFGDADAVTAGNLTIELVGQLSGVAPDALTAGNFI